MANNRICAHPECTCTASGNSKYCSPACEEAGEQQGQGCNCGHAGCAGESKRTLHA
jgi:hypothetical protein